MSDTKKKALKAIDDFIAEYEKDPAAVRKRLDDEARKKHPEMTEKQLEASWAQVADQFGL